MHLLSDLFRELASIRSVGVRLLNISDVIAVAIDKMTYKIAT